MIKQIALKFVPDIAMRCDAMRFVEALLYLDGIIVDSVFLQLDCPFCIYVYSAAFHCVYLCQFRKSTRQIVQILDTSPPPGTPGNTVTSLVSQVQQPQAACRTELLDVRH